MSKVVFIHQNNHPFRKSFTAAVRLPDIKALEAAICLQLLNPEETIPVTMSLEFGLSKVHKKDNYSKAIGRMYSQARLKQTHFIIHSVFSNEKSVSITLTNSELNFNIQLYYLRKTKSIRVYHSYKIREEDLASAYTKHRIADWK